ncbi:hypothetical protein MJO28_001472 [Puccinia striiformis f. sp. tritici]|uniref:Uncharacterized protein n=1 Tax=Puccinia striiformis f. sp. tritici TaxID=168172 RepID=A0ACC0EX42_9BASI|nr:hypothetical protein Pst134EA_003264 [Puccinia striiformis f. sp. tritici]KAH9472660.1 hypothetical protein Pst134EA_003264 [Puccinia striiformis f. sp. tritici]KAI7960983.1 hypothetical protein MJO28_001472 [Puccinia striiformis f. sp. tritici]
MTFISSSFGFSYRSIFGVTFTQLLVLHYFLTISINGAMASPFRSSTNTTSIHQQKNPSHSHFNLNSITNMASMTGYLTPRCSRSSLSTTISLQDCYGALSQLPFNASDLLPLSQSVSKSVKTCSLTVLRVKDDKNRNLNNQDDPDVNLYAPTLFGPVGRILTACSNQAGTLYLWTGGTNLQVKINNSS